MSLQELFTTSLSEVVGYLKDVVRFILAPGDYLREVVQESDAVTARRLLLYAVGFAGLEVSAFSLTGGSEHVTPYTVLGIATMEAFLGLLFMPSFYAVNRYLRIPRPLKATLAYCLTFKSVYFTPILILYSLFLVTEDYTFAMLRGYGTYVQFLVYVLVLPIALSRGLRHRVVATGLSVCAAVLIFVLIDRVGKGFQTSMSHPERLSALYDPIGTEVDELAFVDLAFMESKDGELRRWADKADSLLLATKNPDAAVGGELLAGVRRDWTNVRGMVQPALEETRETIREGRAKAVFQTTKRLLTLAKTEADRGEAWVNAADGFAATGSAFRYLRMERAKIAFFDATKERVGTLLRYVEARNRLKSEGLLYCCYERTDIY